MPGWKPDCFKGFSKQKEIERDPSNCDDSGTKKNAHIPEYRKGITYVELMKKEGCGLGLTISGGTDKKELPWVSNLRPGSIAARSDGIEWGDLLVAVNGIHVMTLTHGEIINLLKNAAERVIMELEYELPDPVQKDSYTMQHKTASVNLEKDDVSLGFVLRGGLSRDPTKTRPLTVGSIRPASVADREGSLKRGDRIVAINEINVLNVTQFEAQEILDHIACEVTLLIEYDVSIIDAVQNASGPLLVEIDKTKGCSLGLSLCGKVYKSKPITVIDYVKPASIADRSGALHFGDQVLSIDGTNLEHMTVAEAGQLLKSNLNEQIKLEIITANQLKPAYAYPARTNVSPSVSYSTLQRFSTRLPTGALMPTSDSRYSTMSNRASGSRKYDTWGAIASHARKRDQSNISIASSALSVMLPGNQLCRSEVMQLTLLGSHRGLGINLEGGLFSTETMTEAPVIVNVEPGSNADRSGVVQEGDRILAINGRWLDECSLEEARHMLRAAGAKCQLQIEFDIAESVIPSCGVYSVKLVKKGVGLGITLSADKSRTGNCILITHVKKGSAAYRSGTIQPGCHLLAIDNIRLERCTVGDAAQILENSGNVVKLKIQKTDSLAESNPVSTITYTVELEKHGGSLGLTISGTEEFSDPVIISELTDGGLAQRTGALHIGDQILAINGKSLESRALSDAIGLLQNAGDVVTLKLTRKIEIERSAADDHGSTPITSVDSALESWDGSGDAVYTHNSQHHSSLAPTAAQRSKPKHFHSVSLDHQQENFSKYAHAHEINRKFRLPDEEWDTGTNFSYPSSIEAERDDWSNALEDLQTCGQSEVMRNIASLHPEADHNEGAYNLTAEPLYRTKPDAARSRQHSPSAHSRTQCLYPPVGIFQTEVQTDIRSTEPKKDNCDHTKHSTNLLPGFSKGAGAIELHKYTLVKPVTDIDFGFGLSDGLYDKGVFISAVRGDTAAGNAGLKQFDRILKVNDTNTKLYDCSQTVPLINQSGDRLVVVVCRNPLAQRQVRLPSMSWQCLDNSEPGIHDRSSCSHKTV